MAQETPKDSKKEKKPEGPLKAFAGNTYDDYYDHGMAEFPLPARAFMHVVAAACYAYTKLMWPWKIEHADLLAKKPGGHVIIQNHESMLEPVITVVALWYKGVRTRIVYKSEFDKIGIATWFFSRVGGFPVSRGKADMKAVRRARAALQRGEYLLIYPEGTRVKNDADSEVHGGYALMAQLAKAPVQPTAIVGARKLHFRKHVKLDVGEPIEWSSLEAAKKKEQLAEMEKRGMAEVFALRDALRQANPGLED